MCLRLQFWIVFSKMAKTNVGRRETREMSKNKEIYSQKSLDSLCDDFTAFIKRVRDIQEIMKTGGLANASGDMVTPRVSGPHEIRPP